METITVKTVKLGGRHQIANEEKTNPDAITVWDLTHRECLVDDEIEAGRRATALGLIAPNGAYDRDAVLLSKGLTLAERLLTGWNRTTGEGAPLPIAPENVGTLPKSVLLEFAGQILYGKAPTQEELDAAKKP